MATTVTLTPGRNASTSLTESTLEEVLGRPVQFSPTKDGEAFIAAALAPCPEPCHRHNKRGDCGGGKQHRLALNVTAVTALVLDYDKIPETQADAIIQQFQAKGLEFYAYETYSHAPAKDSFCFRIVLPFAEPCPMSSPDQWIGTRQALVTHFGATDADPACSDAARLYYLPRTPPGEEPRTCEHVDGPRLDWRPFYTKAAPKAKPKPPAAPERAETRPVDLGPIFEGLKKPGGDLGVLCGRLARGEPLSPKNGRAPGAPVRHIAWRAVTVHVANLLEGWESSEPIYESVFRPAWAAEIAESPNEYTPWESMRELFEGARASAPEYKAQKQAKNEAAAQALRALTVAKTALASADAEAALETADAEAALETDEFKPDLAAWADKLKIVQTKGSEPKIKRCTENVAHILAECPQWKGALRFSVLTQTIEVVGGPFGKGIHPLTDETVTKTTNWLSDNFDLAYTDQTVYAQLCVVARDNEYDPVAAYLRGTKWDGIERLGGMLTTYFGTADKPWAEIIGRKWMVSAVARALQPGCKSDCTLVIEGVQGIGKTSAFQALAGGADRFCTLKYDTKDEQAIFVIHSKWIVELGELHTIRRSDMAHMKGWLTETNDNYRPKYGRVSIDKPRRCAFVGTTNDYDWGSDPTGLRRFWPEKSISGIDVKAIEEDRDQLWAEAVALYDSGLQWWLTPEEEKMRESETDQRAPADVVAEQIEFWVATQKPERRAQGFTMRDLITLGLQQGVEGIARSQGLEIRIGIALKRMRWTKKGRPPKHFPPDAVLTVVRTPPVGPKDLGQAESNTEPEGAFMQRLGRVQPGGFVGGGDWINLLGH